MKKGDICIVGLLQNTGREQSGMRPAIILSDTKTNIAIVVPLTSNQDALRFPFTFAISSDSQNNLNHESTALIFHIQSIDKSKILKTIGKVSKNHRDKIDTILSKMLGL
jgi:mRNA-degrading endonuclease toxin of MazEF toxin-antitoxin module